MSDSIDALWDFDDPATSEIRFRSAILETDEPDVVAEIETQLARSIGLQRRFDEANAVLDAIAPQTDRVRVRLLLERGRVLNSSGKADEARPLFEEAWFVAQACGEDRLAVDAAHMVAIVASDEEQLKWNELAISLALSSADPAARSWLGSLYNNVGWTYHDRGDFAEALEMFTRAVQARKENGQHSRLAEAQWAVARCLRSLGRLEESLELQLSLPETDGYVQEELGELYLQMGWSDTSTEHFRLAYASLCKDEWLCQAEPSRLERLRRLGHGEG